MGVVGLLLCLVAVILFGAREGPRISARMKSFLSIWRTPAAADATVESKDQRDGNDIEKEEDDMESSDGERDQQRSGSSTPEATPRPPTIERSQTPPPPSLDETPASLDTWRAPGTPEIMPPPPVPQRSPRRTSLPPSETSSSSLRPPSTGPLPNRGGALPVNRTSTLLQPTSGLRVPITKPTMLNPATGNAVSSARKKVHLAPGHSPLDWANLQRSGKNLSGVPFPQRVTPSQLAANNGRKGKPAWSSFQGKVYNLGPYLPFHPGGSGELMRAAGKSADKLFFDVHPWVNWENIMGECLVGFMVDERPNANSLDDMD